MLNLIFKIVEYIPTSEQILVKFCRQNSTVSIDDCKPITIECKNLNFSTYEDLKLSITNFGVPFLLNQLESEVGNEINYRVEMGSSTLIEDHLNKIIAVPYDNVIPYGRPPISMSDDGFNEIDFLASLDPKCKRFHRNYEEFSICVNIGKKGYVLAEHFNERFSAFYYLIKGSGKFGKLFDSNYLDMHEKKVLNVQDYLYDEVIFQSTEDFHMIGFNILDKRSRWDYKLLTDDDKTLIMQNKTNFLICLNGNTSISGKSLKRYDYLKLEEHEKYTIDTPGSAEICIFSKI